MQQWQKQGIYGIGEWIDMARLIYADDVKELLMGLDSLPWEEEVDDLIGDIPTAYDVDAVIKELEEYRDMVTIQARGFVKTAINIVKDGGKYE